MRSSTSTEETPSPRSSARPSSVPQRNGEGAPAGGGTCVGRRPEHLADVAGGRPAHEPDRAAGPAYPQQLGGSLRLVGREHDAEHRRDGVEARVGERERLGVTFEQRDVEAFHLGAETPVVQQRGDIVDADDLAATPRGCDRGVAVAGGDVEHAPPGVQVGRVAETLRDVDDLGRDGAVVTARPHRLLPGLERPEVERRPVMCNCHLCPP